MTFMNLGLDIDFAEFGCDSSFPCPECGELISSEDTSGRVYSIAEVRIEEGTVQGLIIRCNCGASMLLCRPIDPHEGFSPVHLLSDDCELEEQDYDLEFDWRFWRNLY